MSFSFNLIKSLFFVLLITLKPFVGNSQVKNGLVAKYSFNDGTPKDEVGGNHAKAYNVKLKEDRFGNLNSAYLFLGSYDSYINLGTSRVLKPKKGSISLWMNIEQVVYKGQGVLCNHIIYTGAHSAEDFNEAYVISYNFDLKQISGSNSFSEFKQATVNQAEKNYLHMWYHVVYTYDNTSACLYINGELKGKVAKNFETRFLAGDSVIVGCRNGIRNKRFFYGTIDDIEIYNRVLSQSEILQLYNAPNPNKKSIVIKLILVCFILAVFIVLLWWWIKWRIAKGVKLEKEKNALNARLFELETRAIRTQMNPHFIFNSLNTLQRFILEDDKVKSYAYLIEFSKLLRKLLESSESDTISLKDEIEILMAYLDIEKMRFDNSFEYKIISEITDLEKVYIPFMLVQPFAENAIWHGLLNKNGKRLLTISFKDLDEKRILCEVEDNGVGRGFKNQDNDPIKKKSLALDFIKHRLELLEQSTNIKCFFEIIDKKDDQQNSLGTIIKIIIPKSK